MLYSYELNGVKDSFSDWISNISPEDTFIVSNTKKEQTKNPNFKWQKDNLSDYLYKDQFDSANFLGAMPEGAELEDQSSIRELIPTTEMKGRTQIFAKSFAISDSTLASSVHGREGELKLQLEKTAKELKIAMEKYFCGKEQIKIPTSSDAYPQPYTASLLSQIAGIDKDNPELPAPTKKGDYAVHKTGSVSFEKIDAIAYALYASGSKAKYILTNPLNATAINKARDEAITAKVEQYKITDKSIPSREIEIPTLTDTRGKTWEIVYSRFVPSDLVYFVDVDSIKQFVLREPKASQLAKKGSFETWQLVVEVGLAVGHPYSCGVLEITTTTTTP